jgi:hypothetical protein
MVDHGEVWILKNAITKRFEEGTMTMELLKAFVNLPMEELVKRLLQEQVTISPVANKDDEAPSEAAIHGE